MPDCTYYNTLISASLDGELTSQEQAELQQHLESCRECRDYHALLKSVSGVLAESRAEPPEKLSKGILYQVELEASRKRFRFRQWRWTAMAAVICLAVFGVVKLGGLGNRAMETVADTAAVAGSTSAGSYQYSAGSTGGGFGSGEADNGAAQVVITDAAEDYKLSADMEFSDRDAEAPAAMEEDLPVQEMGALMAPADLPGYDVYYSLGEEAHYYSVLILYGELPEGVKPDRNWTALDAPAGQRRWELSLDAVLELELQAVFAEIYYDDLMADTGLVIVLEEEK